MAAALPVTNVVPKTAGPPSVSTVSDHAHDEDDINALQVAIHADVGDGPLAADTSAAWVRIRLAALPQRTPSLLSREEVAAWTLPMGATDVFRVSLAKTIVRFPTGRAALQAAQALNGKWATGGAIEAHVLSSDDAQREVASDASRANYAPATPLAALLRESSPHNVAHFVAHSYGAASADAAAEAVVAVLPLPRPDLEVLAAALAAMLHQWPMRAALRQPLVARLVRLLGSRSAPAAVRRDAGSFLGLLFSFRYFDAGDDPFDLAQRLVSTRAANEAEFVTAVACLARELTTSPFAVQPSARRYATTLSTLARTHLDPEVRAAAIAAAAMLTMPLCDASVPPPPAAGTPSSSFVANSSGTSQHDTSGASQSPSRGSSKRLADDLRRRTVYVSHLNPDVSQQQFMAWLNTFGAVNKVRVCATKGFPTLYAFVEMANARAAAAVVEHDAERRRQRARLPGPGAFPTPRCSAAKTSVQDTAPDDALCGSDGACVRPCTFSATTPNAPVSAAVTEMARQAKS